MITENLSTLKIHKLTQAQYDRELAAGRIDANAIYLTPDEEIDLTPYATVEQLNTKASASDVEELQTLVGDEKVSDQISAAIASKSDADHTHNYAGSSSAGGAATSAVKLETARKINGVGFDGSADITTPASFGVATSGTGSAYTATVDGITSLTAGVSFIMIPHVVSASTTPTLNVNNLGTKTIRRRVSNATTSTSAGYNASWLAAKKPIRVEYDGTYWIADLPKPSAADMSGTLKITNGGTNATTVSGARENLGLTGITASSSDGISYTATVPGIDSLATGASFIMIPQITSNTTAPTVNVNNLGAKNIARYGTAKTVYTYTAYSETWLEQGKPIHLVYDGGRWVALGLPQVSADEISGTLAVKNGGTGANTEQNARVKLGVASNQNLLDNWYFADPINQRGNTSLSTEGYFIDRWKFETWNATSPEVHTQYDYGLVLQCETASTTSNSTYLRQYINNPSRFSEKTVTLSARIPYAEVNGEPRLVIYASGDTTINKYYSITSTSTGIISVTATLPSNITTLYVGIGNFSNYGGKGNFKLGIHSMKLEFGDISTLTYNDPAPKKSEQLLECQRYYVRFPSYNAFAGYKSTTPYAFIQLPTPLHRSPSTSNGEITFANSYFYSNGTRYAIDATNLGCNDNGMSLRLVFDDSAQGTKCPNYTGYNFVCSFLTISVDL